MLKKSLGMIYSPVIAVGAVMFIEPLYPVSAIRARFPEILLDPEVNVPLILAAFSVIAAVLSYVANEHFVETNPDTRFDSAIGVLAISSVILLTGMMLFVTDREARDLWFAAYALLCLVNSAWNFVAVEPAGRMRHVLVNASTGVTLLGVLVWAHWLIDKPFFIYLLILALSLVKAWQRKTDRAFRELR